MGTRLRNGTNRQPKRCRLHFILTSFPSTMDSFIRLPTSLLVPNTTQIESSRNLQAQFYFAFSWIALVGNSPANVYPLTMVFFFLSLGDRGRTQMRFFSAGGVVGRVLLRSPQRAPSFGRYLFSGSAFDLWGYYGLQGINVKSLKLLREIPYNLQ